jgi:SagB-type dehydrogenase family enzyme
MPTTANQIGVVLDYHSRTKHHLHRFAASLGYLDWATQPDPFRTFDGAQTIDLPLSADRVARARYVDLYSPESVVASPLNRDSVGALFELALGLSAWKQYEQTRWSLRCNPSSGNLHPTEGYAILPESQGLDAGVYHYLSRDHRLERRCTPGPEGGQRLSRMLPDSLLVGLSSIHWREAWKYGERAFRYCQHDIGHAIATVRYAAAALGWKARLLDVSDTAIADVLGLSREEDFSDIDEADREHPAALLLLGATGIDIKIADVQDVMNSGTWGGRPNALSPDHIRWPAIDIAARATWRSGSTLTDIPVAGTRESAPAFHRNDSARSAQLPAAELIRQRRSAVALDDSTSISAGTFYGMLDRLLPRSGVAPWDALPWPPHLHCGIFVHRVDDLAPGLYLFLRDANSQEKVKAAIDPHFLFEHPEGCPEHLPLFRLIAGDFRQQAQVVSCRQRIAGAGAFSLGMIAEFRESLLARGAWWYRRLFWEAGVLGQVLYLEAEAAGVRGTGIGCYFDDAFHDILGLRDNQFQSLYHFTTGGPIEDTRLTTLPAYAHLDPERAKNSVSLPSLKKS